MGAFESYTTSVFDDPKDMKLADNKPKPKGRSLLGQDMGGELSQSPQSPRQDASLTADARTSGHGLEDKSKPFRSGHPLEETRKPQRKSLLGGDSSPTSKSMAKGGSLLGGGYSSTPQSKPSSQPGPSIFSITTDPLAQKEDQRQKAETLDAYRTEARLAEQAGSLDRAASFARKAGDESHARAIGRGLSPYSSPAHAKIARQEYSLDQSRKAAREKKEAEELASSRTYVERVLAEGEKALSKPTPSMHPAWEFGGMGSGGRPLKGNADLQSTKPGPWVSPPPRKPAPSEKPVSEPGGIGSGDMGHYAKDLSPVLRTHDIAQQSNRLMPVPKYRNQAEGLKGQHWNNWSLSLGKLGNLSPAERKSYKEIFAAEGGFDTDQNSGAASGITPDALDRAIKDGALPSVNKGTFPKELSMEDRARAYRHYFDDVLSTVDRTVIGSSNLQQIGNYKASAAFADTMFAHGRHGGAEAIQNAINKVAPGSVAADGNMGPKTFEAFRKLAGDPKTNSALLYALGSTRWERVKDRKDAAGWLPRIDHFRFQKSL